MAVLRTLIPAGSDDNRWSLWHGENPTDVFVFHESNGPSGRTPSCVEFVASLALEKGSPEHRALLMMIGSLVEAGPAASAPPLHGPKPGAAGAEQTLGEAAASI
jgi:hypothetical protein